MRIERLSDPDAAADIDAVAALEAASFTNPWPRDQLVWELRNSDVTRVFVLRNPRGLIVGFCLCWVIFDELHINTLAVAPELRRQGMATLLMQHVLAETAKEGARKATLEVRASNEAALALYERLGFRVTATRPGYYTNPQEDALILWLEGGRFPL
jgi:ribosomal-protein-alanine N-acetyltransferase